MRLNSQLIQQTLILVVLAAGLTAGCSDRSDGESGGAAEIAPKGPLTVYVVNYPLHYFAGRIGGSAVEVVFPAPADVDPAYWMPDSEAIAAYQSADLILLNGAGYARWTGKASLPLSRMVDTSESFGDRLIALKEATTHSHGAEGEHEHRGWAFTTWLDPELAIAQARAVMEALAEARPGEQSRFQRAFDELDADLRRLDNSLASALSNRKAAPLVMSHPVYQYLVRRYELNARSVHWEPDAEPDAAMWKEFTGLRAAHPAAWMVWEGEPLAAVKERLAAIGVGSVVFAPCGNVPEDGDYLDIMERNVKNLSNAFGKD